jgi:hypothetical protein
VRAASVRWPGVSGDVGTAMLVPGGASVEKVNDLVRQIVPGQALPFTDVRQATDHLATVWPRPCSSLTRSQGKHSGARQPDFLIRRTPSRQWAGDSGV